MVLEEKLTLKTYGLVLQGPSLYENTVPVVIVVVSVALKH